MGQFWKAPKMTGILAVQGRDLSGEDIGQMKWLTAEHPDWGGTRLSAELCRRWEWRNAQGRRKDMAARAPMLKLERSGHIQLPPRQRASANEFQNRRVSVGAPQPGRSTAYWATRGLCR